MLGTLAFGVVVWSGRQAAAEPSDHNVATFVEGAVPTDPPTARSTDPGFDNPVALGGLMPSAGGRGVRLQLDVLAGGGWAVGVAASLIGGVSAPSRSGTAYVARTDALFGPVRLREQLGVGEASVETTMASSATPVAEGAVLANLHLTTRWSLDAGPIVQMSSITGTTLMIFAGVEHR